MNHFSFLLLLLLLQFRASFCSSDALDLTKNESEGIEGNYGKGILNFIEPSSSVSVLKNNNSETVTASTHLSDYVGVSTALANATEIKVPSPQSFKAPTPMSLKDLSQYMHVMPTEEISVQLDLLGDRIFDPIYYHSKWNLFLEAVSTDNLDFVRMFLSRASGRDHFNINTFDSYFGSAYFYVKSVKMARLLQNHGMILNFPDLPCRQYSSLYDIPPSCPYIAHVKYGSEYPKRVDLMVNAIEKNCRNRKKQRISYSREEMYEKMLKSLTRRKKGSSNTKIYIEFKNEQGLDYGGPTKDFIILLKNKLIDEGKTLETCPKFGYWKLKTDAPNDRVRLLGYIIGLSIAHKVPLNMKFSPLLYYLMCDLNPNRDDIVLTNFLFEIPEYQQALDHMKSCTVEELNEFYPEFPTNPEDIMRPWKRQRIPARFESKLDIMRYFSLKAHEILIQPIAHLIEDFVSGIECAINPALIIEYISPTELSTLISGIVDYSAEDWKSLAKFKGNEFYKKYYDQFFEIVEEMTPSERSDLLKFVTSLEVLPPGGFGSLKNIPVVSVMEMEETNTFPIASTCFNQLTIFPTKSREEFKKLLFKAVELGKDSFDLA